MPCEVVDPLHPMRFSGSRRRPGAGAEHFRLTRITMQAQIAIDCELTCVQTGGSVAAGPGRQGEELWPLSVQSWSGAEPCRRAGCARSPRTPTSPAGSPSSASSTSTRGGRRRSPTSSASRGRRSAPISARCSRRRSPTSSSTSSCRPRAAASSRRRSGAARTSCPRSRWRPRWTRRGRSSPSPPRRGGCMRSSRTAASIRACGGCGSCLRTARSGRSPASIATSSSARISAASATRWSTSCCSTWRSTPSTRSRFVIGHDAARGLLPGDQPAGLLVRARRRGQRHLRVRGRRGGDLSRLVVRRGRRHRAGRARWRIVGTKGTLLWDGADGFEARVVTGDRGLPARDRGGGDPRVHRRRGDPGARERHPRLRRRLERGRAPETVATDNIKSLAMVFGAIDSAEPASA